MKGDTDVRFMVIVKADKNSEAGVMPTEQELATMGKYNQQLIDAGVMVDGAGLQPSSKGARVGFKNGQASTVIGVTIVSQATHSAVGDGSLELDQLVGCDPGKTCSGYMQMSFGNLDPGGYQIQITRDGDKVASTTFSVTS